MHNLSFLRQQFKIVFSSAVHLALCIEEANKKETLLSPSKADGPGELQFSLPLWKFTCSHQTKNHDLFPLKPPFLHGCRQTISFQHNELLGLSAISSHGGNDWDVCSNGLLYPGSNFSHSETVGVRRLHWDLRL